MSVSPKILKERGCDPKLWRELFAPRGDKPKPREIKKLELLIQNRVNDGQMRCLARYRTWAAVDMAYDAPFAQTTPTIIQSLLGRKWDKTEDLLAELERWNIKEDELFIDGTLSNGVPCKVLNPPTFFKVLVPLVKAYVTIRWAKLYNDRNRNPLFPFDPLQPNEKNRLRCSIWEYLIQVMSADFNYNAMVKDAIFQTLMYSVCLSFPRDVWTREKQLEEIDGEEKEVIQKEGIRYELPHPSLMFYDLDYPIHTFNSDTGCEFAGYWKVVRYGDILDNANFWNRRQVGYSSRDWNQIFLTNNFYQELFPCRLQFPVCGPGGTATGREQQAVFYSSNQRDAPVTQTDLFMRLTPSKWKLGNYRHPIWVRFIVAADSTVIYAEPCAYPPVRYSGYDSNSIRATNASLALEVVPFQDIVGNLLSQILLTAKQNLLKVFAYDSQQVNSTDIDGLKNAGELKYRGLNFIAFDPMKLSRSGGSAVEKMFHTIDFGQKSVQELFQCISTTLALLERLLQLSAQEAGAAASHQQSKAEIDQISSATNNRVAFTGSAIDDFMEATKDQLYEASLAYMADEVEALVPADIPNVETHLAEMGFKILETTLDKKLRVSGSKRLLKVNSLAAPNNSLERRNDAQTAQIMMQTVGQIAANEKLLEAVGVRPILELFQQAAILAGADKDFSLKPDQRQELSQLQAMAEQIQIAAAKHAAEEIGKPAAEEMAKMQEEIQTLSTALGNLIKTLNLQPQPVQNAPAPAQPAISGGPGEAPVPALV